MSKWIYKLVYKLVIIIVFIGVGMLIENKRLSDSEYESLIKIANRQTVEIAIIEQAAKLQGYKQQFQKAQLPVVGPKVPK